MSLPESVLIANRGEIAVRVIKTCQRLGIRTIAAHSSADRNTPAVRMATQAVEIGPADSRSSYLNVDQIIAACKKTQAGAVHPGYGFLSENADFAERLEREGITFIGPTPATIRSMGDKISSRKLMQEKGVPVVPGYNGEDQGLETLRREAMRIGLPVLIKASAGGGGRGMRLVERESDFEPMLAAAKREALGAFGDDRVFVEKYVSAPRHIEIQVLGDASGNVVSLFERECSLQRRHQKILEESPSPALTPELRMQIAKAGVLAAEAVRYTNAGTVEFIYSDVEKTFYFLEMNTRLQVEHPVTELVTGIDLVEQQLRIAAGLPFSFNPGDLKQTGHAVEVRLYAEDPERNFMPATGMVHLFETPTIPGIRIDSGIESGDEVTIHYDPMIAKIIAHAKTRDEALDLLGRALEQTVLFGPNNNLDFLRAIVKHPVFRSGKITTAFLAEQFPAFKRQVTPDTLELARAAAGVLHYIGGKRFSEARESPTVASTGGDLMPWEQLEGFRLWN
ncbi:MAG: acetyl-CoA carboxylase biotin carboxylase subunit [Leptospirales bacterium]|nr:acetyl-CoA carboxylase biotin carboxylase subunit [Leptospirales bacterium]